MSPPNRSLEGRMSQPRAIIPDQQGAPSKLRLGGPASSQTERSVITEVSPSRGTFAAAPLQDVVPLRDVFSPVEHLCHVERLRHVERSRHVGTFASRRDVCATVEERPFRAAFQGPDRGL
jgi:hypothetical protein